MADCVFCGIVSGEIDAHVVYENEHAMAFLDANPIVDGHTVVVPKKHVERLTDMPDKVLVGTFSAVQKVNHAILIGRDADGTNVGLNDGEAAGQAIPHTHVHVIPRYSGDGGGSLHSIISGEANEDFDEVVKQLKSAI